jgi:hypothetical protein
MDDARPTLEQLKLQWKKRLQEAERELELGRAEVRKVEEQLRSQSIPSPDIHYAYQKALRAKTLALEKYAKVLTVFNDLVLHDTVPEEGS